MEQSLTVVLLLNALQAVQSVHSQETIMFVNNVIKDTVLMVLLRIAVNAKTIVNAVAIQVFPNLTDCFPGYALTGSTCKMLYI